MSIPTVRLVERAAEQIRGERLLVVGAPAPIDALGDATYFFTDFAAGRERSGAWYAGRDHDVALVFLPKGKRRRDMWLAMAGAALRDDGRVFLVGQKDEGVKSAGDAVATYFAGPVGEQPGAHARLIGSSMPRRDRDDANLEAWLSPWETHGLALVSLPGTFSEGKLDVGSEFLLRHWTPPSSGRLLDVGCGAGVLGLLAARAGAEATLVDADQLAVESTRRSAAANGLHVNVLASDVYSEVGLGFDQIVSNPPFHQGVRTEYSVADRIIREAPERLRPGGELIIVANAFLPYAAHVYAAFAGCETVAKDRQFAVYRARKR
jgi:16S rRNA (guanine1207-N2)-methyltransferase